MFVVDILDFLNTLHILFSCESICCHPGIDDFCRNQSSDNLSPEAENAVFLVTVKKEVITAAKQLQPSEITEDMLPEKDYFFDVDDYIDDDETSIDRYQLDVPSKDKETFSTLISRMGWRVWEIGKSAANVAAVW